MQNIFYLNIDLYDLILQYFLIYEKIDIHPLNFYLLRYLLRAGNR